MNRKEQLTIGFSLLLLFCGCSETGTNNGMLKVSLTDSPACGFDQVNVTPAKIRIHESGSADDQDAGWHDIDLSATGKINLTSLMNGVLRELGVTSLPGGRYTQIRLLLTPNSPDAPSNNSVVPSGRSEAIPLEVPDGTLKMIHPFDVEGARPADLALDFDACRSVLQKGDGGYLLKPVVSAVSLTASGRISGVVDNRLSDGNFISNPVITAQQEGKAIKATFPDSNGNFVLGPLLESGAAGSYDVVFTADGAASVMIQSVPVKAQTATAVSNASNPMTLQSASIRTVSGTVIPAGSVIRATQTFSPSLANAALEVRSTHSVLSDGGYQLTLPIGPPSLGLFGAGRLPIPLTADTAVAGIYHLEASAEGFAPEERPVEITDDRQEDFRLAPS